MLQILEAIFSKHKTLKVKFKVLQVNEDFLLNLILFIYTLLIVHYRKIKRLKKYLLLSLMK